MRFPLSTLLWCAWRITTFVDQNDAPENITLRGSNAVSVNENANGAFVGELMTSDQDVGQTHIYKLLNSAGVKFMILNNKSHLRLIWVMKLKVSSRLGFSLKTMVGSLLVWQKISRSLSSTSTKLQWTSLFRLWTKLKTAHLEQWLVSLMSPIRITTVHVAHGNRTTVKLLEIRSGNLQFKPIHW